MDILQRMPWAAQDSVFKKLSEIAEVASLNKEERQLYDESLRQYRDTIIVMEGQYLEGEKKGRAEGIAEGEKKGRAEGIAEGEKKKSIDTAIKMKAKGFAIEDIMDISGLTAEEIIKL
jgi:predicted transposase YdaD